MTDSPLPVTGSIPVVRGALVAVVVTRGRTPYLPVTLAAVAAQTRRPTRVLVVDAAPRQDHRPRALPADDAVARLARTALDDVAPLYVLAVPGAHTFGEAVRQALTVPGVADLAADRGAPRTGAVPVVATRTGAPPLAGTPGATGTASAATSGAPRTGAIPAVGARPPGAGDWLWLLHDDAAPAPTALEELVRAVEHAPSIGVAGVKQRSWDDPTRLLEVGVTTSRLGRRMTGVEDGEVDQGQHDGREDVLGVGLAGALVRLDVWQQLGGPDPALGPFGDGLDLSRRARLAGHRVVVVPRAVVHHAQASLRGLREDDLLHVLTGASAHEPAADTGAAVGARRARAADPRRSFAARRRAHVHAALAGVPLPLLPVMTIGFLLTGVLRSLMRVATKDAVLATAELAAPVVAVLHPARMALSRAAARRTRRLPRRSLRPLQGTWRDVYLEERDRALGRVGTRRSVQAPSELELAELAALTGRRRAGLALLVVTLVGLTVTVLGPLVVAATRGERLMGGGLLPAGADVGALWRAVTTGWVSGGLGQAAPADPLLALLLPLAAVTGGTAQAAVGVLYLGGVLVSGAAAWFAAGAATRSVVLRGWAALTWVAAPTLLLAVDGGRIGAVVAHAALPWVALGVARALGVERRDVVLSGLVGAPANQDDVADEGAAVDGGAAVVAVPAERADVPAAPARPAGSVTAAAAGGLAFAVATAGAPLLLPAGLLALLLVAVTARRHRRRLVVVALPALVLHGPLVVDALGRLPSGGWRALLAEPGLPVASTAAPAWQQLLAWPTSPGAPLAALLGEDAARVLPFVLGGVVVAGALAALVRGPRAARGVRAGWLVAACGLAAAVLAGRVSTAVVGSETVRGWPGAGVSLLLLGLLTAAVLGVDGARGRLQRALGRRPAAAIALTVVALLAPLLPLADWVARTRMPPSGEPSSLVVTGVDGPVVPAVGQQAQASDARSRVLALAADDDGGATYTLLHGDGPQLTERSAAAAARGLRGVPGTPDVAPDDATAEVETLVARLAAGATGDVSAALGDLAVGAVLVPPAVSDDEEATRSELVGRLDATAGLERITENPSGVIWRVVRPTGPGAGQEAPVTAWARVTTPTADGTPATSTPLPARPLAVRTRVPAGEPGRTVVLAERAAPGWRAELDGRPLDPVDAGWRQAFALTPDGGLLTVAYRPPEQTAWTVVPLVVLGLTVLLALPVRRRRGGLR